MGSLFTDCDKLISLIKCNTSTHRIHIYSSKLTFSCADFFSENRLQNSAMVSTYWLIAFNSNLIHLHFLELFLVRGRWSEMAYRARWHAQLFWNVTNGLFSNFIGVKHSLRTTIFSPNGFLIYQLLSKTEEKTNFYVKS